MSKNMKKIFTFFLITLTGGVIHAQITLNGSVDMAIIPFQRIWNDGANEDRFFGAPEQHEVIMGAGAGRYGSGQGPRARIEVQASYEDKIGMRTRIQARTDGIGIEDFLQAWWQPVSWLRLDAGRFFRDNLRGKVNDLDERMNANTVRMFDADAIFSRFRTHRYGGQAGIMISLTPINNLFIGALLYDLKPFTASSSTTTDSSLYDAHPDYVTDNQDVWRRIQAAAAYEIPNIGLLRVQYLGVKPMVTISRISDEVLTDTNQLLYSYMFDTFSITASRIEAAFALTAVPGLTLDIGGKFPIQFKDWDRGTLNIFEKEDESLMDAIYQSYRRGFVWQAPYQASIGIKYTPSGLEPLELAGRVDAIFGGFIRGYANEVNLSPVINAHIWPSWGFSFARVILNAGFEYIGAAYDRNGQVIGTGTPAALNGGYRFGMGISIQKDFFNNSLIKGGIAYKFAGTVNGVREKAVLTIPLYLEFNFR